MVAAFLGAGVRIVSASALYFDGYDSYGRTKWISCGSSAGSYGYVCDSEGRCYVSEALTEDAPMFCSERGDNQ
jgi:hypothetical protein